MSEVQTLDESMEETLSEIRAAEAQEVEEVEAEPAVEETPTEEAEVARDDKGQFAEKDPDPDPDPEPLPEAAIAEPEAPVAQNLLDDDGNELKEYPNPPSTWRALAKSQWKDIPPQIRDEIHKREQDSMRGVEMLKNDANYGRQINSVVAPYMPTINARGSNPEEAIGAMLNAYYVLETAAPTQKAQQLWETAKQYGVINEMVALYTNQQPAQSQGLTQQDVDRIVNERMTAERQQTTEQSIVQEVQQFETALNTDGTLRYPYFENVRQQMGAIVEAEGVDLNTAYERAIWAIPEIRTILMSEQAQADSAKRQDQATAHVEKAKKAQDNNLERSASHSVRQPNPTGSVDDTMAETMANIRSRT